MTDQFEDQPTSPAATPAPVAAKPTAADNTAAPTPARGKKAGGSVAPIALGLSLGLSILAVAAVGYLWLQGAQQQLLLQTSRADIAGASQRVDSQDQQLRQLQRQLDQLQQANTAAKSELDTLNEQLVSQQKRLQSLSTTDRDDWLLAEAEYLMRLANQRLLMGKEIAGASALLKAADDIMVELDDSALFPVRKALAEDMAALRAAGKLDIEGIYLSLAAVANQCDQLQLFEPVAFEPAVEASTQPQNWQQRLSHGLLAAWEKLKGYIRITKRDDIYQPALTPEYEAALRQSLRLMFEQAQMAALAGKQTLYRDSLHKAKQWLNSYYTLDRTSAQAAVATIEELEQAQIEVQLPDISGSLRTLKNYLENRHDIKPQAPTTTSPPAPEATATESSL